VRRIQLAFLALAKGRDGGNGDENKRNAQQHRRRARKFQPGETGAAAAQNRGETDEDAEMPEVRSDDGHERQDKFGLAQARKNPEHHAEAGGNRKAIDQQIIRGRREVAVSRERAAREHFRRVKRERREHRQQQPDDQPQRRAAEQREQRHTARSVNLRVAIQIVFSGVHSNALGFSGAFGSSALAFSWRAIRSARAAAGFCHACAACAIAVAIGR